jgi:hypothetical protein
MTSFKRFLYVVYTLLFVLTIIMMIYNDSLVATFDAQTVHTFWMFWAVFGFVLLMLESVIEAIHHSSKNRNHSQLSRENLELKARLYDDMLASRDTGAIRRRDKDEVVIVKDAREPIHRRGQNDVVSVKDKGDAVWIKERDGDERIIDKDRPGYRNDIVNVKDEGDHIRLRERDGDEKVVEKRGEKRSFFGKL